MDAARTTTLLAGTALLAANAYNVVTVLIVPRSARGLAIFPMRAVRATFRWVARLARTYPAQDRVLALSEPVALVVLLAGWLVVTLVGFTLVDWGLNHSTFAQAFAEAGSSIFTLGFALSHTAGSRAVDFLAAASGLVLVALQIAYLPTLYAAYNRRETLVTLLEARAGRPAWGPELLVRHQLVGLIDNLATLFAEWERWAADVAESHTSYPSLLYLRSPRRENSWLVSLLAAMDAAALALAVDPTSAPTEARMCVRMGFTCLRDIATATRMPFDPDPDPGDPVRLTEEQFAEGLGHLRSSGYRITRSPEDAWAHFRGWRVNYESVAYALAYALDAPPAPWSGPRRLFPAESLAPARPTDRRPGAAPEAESGA